MKDSQFFEDLHMLITRNPDKKDDIVLFCQGLVHSITFGLSVTRNRVEEAEKHLARLVTAKQRKLARHQLVLTRVLHAFYVIRSAGGEVPQLPAFNPKRDTVYEELEAWAFQIAAKAA